MPRMDGPTAVERLRALGYDGLIIGLTGNGMEEDLQYFRNKGVDFVIIKPMKIQDLVSIINTQTVVG